jgi:hypothetical protein
MNCLCGFVPQPPPLKKEDSPYNYTANACLQPLGNSTGRSGLVSLINLAEDNFTLHSVKFLMIKELSHI